MNIVSKRGQPPVAPPPEPKEDVEYGIIIVDYGRMTPEESRRAQETIKEIRKRLDELGRNLDDGWFGKPGPAGINSHRV